MPAPTFKSGGNTVTGMGQVTMADKTEKTSQEFWDSMAKLLAYCSQLEQRIILLEALAHPQGSG
jgi:hypothetical protein